VTTFDTDRVYTLLERHAWNVTAYQIVNPGMEHWFSEKGDAVIGYMRRVGLRVVAGAPVCAEARLDAVLAEWEADCARQRERPCYFGAAGRLFDRLSGRSDHSIIVLGAQPVWDPRDWPEPGAMRSSLRAQLARARNKGVIVREWSVRDAESSPELRRVLGEWLGDKPIPSLHFLVEPQTLARLRDKRIFVAERDGVPVGFLNAAPVPARSGWLTEQFVRAKDAPNGTVELLVDSAVRALAVSGAEYVTMGLVPLSSHSWHPEYVNPFWIRFVLAWIRAHGRRFYNFEGLETFKTKFQPEGWEPIYAASKEHRFSLWTLYAVADAFSDRSPASMLMRGADKAIREEVRRVSAARRVRTDSRKDRPRSPRQT
jgi:phosphatidylglycerol lysyltransferase